jgi:hypothetical protein
MGAVIVMKDIGFLSILPEMRSGKIICISIFHRSETGDITGDAGAKTICQKEERKAKKKYTKASPIRHPWNLISEFKEIYKLFRYQRILFLLT